MAYSEQDWPAGGGRMGELIRTKDWSETSLGPVKNWPQSLRLTLDICLKSNTPICLYWGSDFILFYNDSWKELLGGKTPPSPGVPARKVQNDTWKITGPILEQVFSTGKAVESHNQYLPVAGYEESCIDLSFSPVSDENGSVGGIFTVATEITGRKQAERQLHRSKQDMHLILETSEIGIWDWDIDSDTVTWSENLEAICGMNPGEFDGDFDSFINAVHPDDRESLLAAIQQALDENASYKIEHRCVPRDGRVMWLECRGRVIQDKEGQTVGMTGTCINITERKEAEENLLSSEERFRIMMEQSPLSIQIFDSEGRTLEVNSAWERLWDTSREELTDYNILKDEQLKAAGLASYIRKAFDGEAVRLPAIYYDPAKIGKPGRDRWIEGFIYPSISRDGETFEVALVHHDITERRKAEAKLKRVSDESERQKRLYEAIISSTPDLVYVFDLNYRFTFVNDALLEMWGRTLEESIGKSLLEIGYEPWHAEMHEREIDQVIATKQPVRGEVPFPHATLGRRIYDYILVPVLNGKGEVEAVAGTTRDITERKQAQKKLEFMNETLEERVEERTAALVSYQDQLRSLASELSRAEERERQRLATDLHDNLGQMLAVGKMKLDLLQLQNNQLPDQAAAGVSELAELMDDAIRYTRELMSDLKPPPSLDREDLRTAINWVAETMRKHGLNVSIEDDGQPKPLDEEVRSTLLQSVRELLFNVVKHAGVDDANVILTRQDAQVRIIIEDQGKGFNMQGKKPRPTKEGGFGLFSIRERIDLLGGTLKVISKRGKGTKVMLFTPLKGEKVTSGVPVPDDQKPISPSRASVRTKPGHKIKVLLADDHQMVRTGLRKIIEEEDDMVVIGEASNGNEAVKLAHDTSPDVVVMDVNMPGMNGIDAAREIVSDKPQMRIIGLSLHDRDDVSQAMRRAGASAYLTKSEVFETLCATIRSEATMMKD